MLLPDESATRRATEPIALSRAPTPYRCEFCGVAANSGWRSVLQSKGGAQVCCPLCKASFCLGESGLHKMGAMIWLPEISQAELNAYCAGMFATILAKQSGVEKSAADLYRVLESRKSALSETFAPNATTIFNVTLKQLKDNPGRTEKEKAEAIDILRQTRDRLDITDPGVFVQVACLLERKKVGKVHYQGVRFLPFPSKFKPVIADWIATLDTIRPRDQWTTLMPEEEAVSESAGSYSTLNASQVL